MCVCVWYVTNQTNIQQQLYHSNNVHPQITATTTTTMLKLSSLCVHPSKSQFTIIIDSSMMMFERNFNKKKKHQMFFRIRQKKGCARGYNFLFLFFLNFYFFLLFLNEKNFHFHNESEFWDVDFLQNRQKKNGLIIISIINIIEFLIDNFLSFFEKKFKVFFGIFLQTFPLLFRFHFAIGR